MFSSDLSDEHVLHLRRKYELTERVWEPLEMSDTEILDWMGEYSESIYYVKEIDRFELRDYLRTFQSDSVRGCVRKAAAYHKEENRDF